MNIISCNLIHIVLCTNSKYDAAWRQGGAGGAWCVDCSAVPVFSFPTHTPPPLFPLSPSACITMHLM